MTSWLFFTACRWIKRCQHEGAAGNCSDVCWWKAIIHERFLALWRQQVWQLRVWDLTSSPLLLSIGWVLHLSYLRNMMELLPWVECTLEVEINIYRASSRQKKSQVNWMLLTQSITAKLSLCASIEYTQQMEILLSITACQNRSVCLWQSKGSCTQKSRYIDMPSVWLPTACPS